MSENPYAAKGKVLIFCHGGVVQDVLTDRKDLEIFYLDQDEVEVGEMPDREPYPHNVATTEEVNKALDEFIDEAKRKIGDVETQEIGEPDADEDP